MDEGGLGETVGCVCLLSRVAARLGGMGRNATALQVCRRITELDPSRHQAYFGIAYYLGRLGYLPQALIPHLATAMVLAPNVGAYRINLALAWADLGCYDEAEQLHAPVAPAAIACPRALTRLCRVFERIGDVERARACLARLDAFPNDRIDR